MRNEYKGNCYKCGKEVPEDKGYLQRYEGGWLLLHVWCKNYTPVTIPIKGELIDQKT